MNKHAANALTTAISISAVVFSTACQQSSTSGKHSAGIASRSIRAAPIAGLNAFYKFDEASGTVAMDFSANGFNGTLVNSPTRVPIGFINSDLSFSGVNDYVNVPHNAALDSYPLTVSTWIKTNASSTSGERGIVNKYVAFSSNGYTIHMNNGNLCAWYFRDASNYVYDNSGCQFNV